MKLHAFVVGMALFFCPVRGEESLKMSISGPYRATIDFGLTLAQIEKQGRYDQKGIYNDDENKKRGLRKIVFFLATPNQDLGALDNDVRQALAQEGMRPADLRELLTFGRAYPAEQKKYEIVALGTFASGCGFYSPALYSSLTLPIEDGFSLSDFREGKVKEKALPKIKMVPGAIKRYANYVLVDPGGGCNYIKIKNFPKERTRLLVVRARK